MDFEPNDEQRMIADSAARVFEDLGYPGRATGDAGWQALADLGLLDAAMPEVLGGFAAGLDDLLYLLVETGRKAAPEPLIGAAILPGLALSRAGEAAPAALSEGPYCLADGTGLSLTGGALSGQLSVVPGADLARALLVCLPGDRLSALPMDAPGLTRTACRLADGRGAADLELDGVTLAEGALGAPVPGLGDWLRDAAATAFAADALGAMLTLREMTLDYLKERRQFGRPIGSFQALQHAMVDIHHDTEHFLSLCHLAAHACGGDDAAARQRAVSALKLFLGVRMRKAAASAIQLHGGIGMTDEYALGQLVKRVLVADMLNGNAASHGARLAAIIADEIRAMPAKTEEKIA